MTIKQREVKLKKIDDFYNLVKLNAKAIEKYTISRLVEYGYEVINGDGYIYAKGIRPVLLVTSIETKFGKLPKNISIDNNYRLLAPIKGEFEFYHCGIYALLQIAKECNCDVLIVTDNTNEGGHRRFLASQEGISARKNYNCIVEIDYTNEESDENFLETTFFTGYVDEFGRDKEFIDFARQFGYEDSICLRNSNYIVQLTPVLEAAGININCGYMLQEIPTLSKKTESKNLELSSYINFDYLCESINHAKEMIKSCNKRYPYIYKGENEAAKATLLMCKMGKFKKEHTSKKERNKLALEIMSELEELVGSKDLSE